MRSSTWFALSGQILRFLAVLAILLVLAPKLVFAFANLYNYIVHRDRIPSGNPLKVEAPSPLPDSEEPFVFKLRPGQRN